MNNLLAELRRELEIRNFSRKTVKGYVYSVEKFFDFSNENGLRLNEEAVKGYVQISLKDKNISGINKEYKISIR